MAFNYSVYMGNNYNIVIARTKEITDTITSQYCSYNIIACTEFRHLTFISNSRYYYYKCCGRKEISLGYRYIKHTCIVDGVGWHIYIYILLGHGCIKNTPILYMC